MFENLSVVENRELVIDDPKEAQYIIILVA